jgi:hypothetical protein
MPKPYVETLRTEMAALVAMLEPLEAGRIHVGERNAGQPWLDRTQAQIDHLKRTIENYRLILGKGGT